MKSILDNLYNVDDQLILTFDQLFAKFAEVYWNLVLKYHILQKKPDKMNRRSAIENILYEAKNMYQIEDGIPFESLTDDMMLDICSKVKDKCKNNVVGALFADLSGLFYSFSKRGQWIQFNPQMYEFVCKHKVAIEKLNYYEWARFLEKVNRDDAVDHLLSKIDESDKRNNLSYYRDILFSEFENKCFYCGKEINKRTVEVDHFIPWSFIKDDQLWNFVLSCHDCNSKKSDKLADKGYLDQIIHRNDIGFVEHQSVMKNYQSKRLIKIYTWAQKNGYSEIWTPKKRKAVQLKL